MPALPFQDFYQLAYVTTDLDRALGMFADLYDVGEFADRGEVTRALDDGGEMRIRIAFAFIGSLQLEIIEPRGGRDAVYRHELPTEGFGMAWHHVAFKAPSPRALGDVRASLIRAGHEVVLSGGTPGTSMFFYADARATLGHYLEYIYLSPEQEEFHRQFPHH